MKLYDYQMSELHKSELNWMYPWDTGTGKTIMALAHFDYHLGQVKGAKQIIIIAPAAKVKEGGWERDIDNYFGDDKPLHYVISYNKLKDALKLIDINTYLIFDECHYIKNYKAQRSIAALELSKKAFGFVLLSATPASNGNIDLANYLTMFGFFSKPTQFIKEYAKYGMLQFGGNVIRTIVGWKNEELIHVLFHEHCGKALKKEDCLDLPPIVFTDTVFKASKEYKAIKKDRVLRINDKEMLFDTTSKWIYGLRLYTNLDDKCKYLSMLRESTEENILIFYNFESEKDKIINELQCVDYEVSGHKMSIPEFKDYKTIKNKTTIVQIQAGSAGIELQYNSIVVYFSPTWSYQDYEQSLGRAYRNGQDKKVTVYRFITKNTIEEKVYEKLNEKKDFTEQLFMTNIKK